MDLLADHHRHGRRFEPLEFVEQGRRVAVRVAVGDRRRSGTVEIYKVFTFGDEEAADEIVLLQDCSDERHARALLSQP